MKNELDALLCERYPLIFANRTRSIRESCMGRGVACGDGWFTLIDTLCERLQFWTEHNGAPQVVATQVKEKWGELCFYAHGANDEQLGMIAMAKAMSARMCETCGQPGQVLVSGGIFLTRCPMHAPTGAITHAEFAAKHTPGNCTVTATMATMIRLADYPLLAQMASHHTTATRLDARACRYVYERGLPVLQEADVANIQPAERALIESIGLAALLKR